MCLILLGAGNVEISKKRIISIFFKELINLKNIKEKGNYHLLSTFGWWVHILLHLNLPESNKNDILISILKTKNLGFGNVTQLAQC